MWAPRPQRVRLVAVAASDATSPSHSPNATQPFDLIKDADDWWSLPPEALAVLPDGELDYGYLLDDDPTPRPDPRSRRQPFGVHGLSRTDEAAAWAWTDHAWTGRQLAGSVIYELHVGTFTREGTLDAAIARLDHLVALGVDLVELMPVNAFNGPHGWGYDGVAWFAVHEEYGGPAAYRRFVDACHRVGLGVVQDVVYNHLGPSGNYLPEFGPYLTDEAATTWGAAVNLDGEDSDEVRRYIIDNALMWLREFHVDGLRLDAVHALIDPTAIHLLEELSVEVAVLSASQRRPMILIAESDLNDPRMITPREAGGYGVDAQWSDDFHHALIANLTGESSGYYADFAELDALAKVIQTGFYHDGTKSTFRGRRHGRPLDTSRTPAWRLVVCSDNHDQIGNRADGRRLRARGLSEGQLEIAAVVTLLAPGTPMIFMGEEWGAASPFVFFASHPEPDLAEATRAGRLAEFAKLDWDPELVPDPMAASSFSSSRLDWAESTRPGPARLLATYRALIALRRRCPAFTDPRLELTEVDFDADQGWFVIIRHGADESFEVMINFGSDTVTIERGDVEAVLAADAVVVTDTGVTLPAHGWAVVSHTPERSSAG